MNIRIYQVVFYDLYTPTCSPVQNIPTTDILLFIALRISSINLYDMSVEMLGLKPYCSYKYVMCVYAYMCE